MSKTNKEGRAVKPNDPAVAVVAALFDAMRARDLARVTEIYGVAHEIVRIEVERERRARRNPYSSA